MLRRFAVEARGDWRLNVFDIERQQVRANQNVKDVCAGNYTYDTDNSVESFLERQIESPAASVITRLLNSPTSASSSPSDEILRFISVQIARTPQAYEGYIEFQNGFMGTVFETLASLNDEEPEAARNISVLPREPRQVLSYMAAYAATNFRLLSDLRVALVLNESPQEFLISDHPVFQHNFYLRDSAAPLSASMTVRGLQMFLPLSPQITYCLYDSSVYAYHEERGCVVVRATASDVQILNSFQAINAERSLFARSADMAPEMKALGARFATVSSFTSHACATAPVEDTDGKLRSLHYSWRKAVRLESMPSFIKVKNKVRRRPVVCEHRRPNIVAAHELADAQLNASAR